MWSQSTSAALMAISLFSHLTAALPQGYQGDATITSITPSPVATQEVVDVVTDIVTVETTVFLEDVPQTTASACRGLYFSGAGSASSHNTAYVTGTFCHRHKHLNRTIHHGSTGYHLKHTGSLLLGTLGTANQTSTIYTWVSSTPAPTPTTLSSVTSSSASSSESSLVTSYSSTAVPSTTVQPSSTSSVASSASPSATSNSSTDSFLRGVNLGGWLVLEQWMDSDLFSGAFANATDEWTFSEIDGAAAALENHWSTFFTESDIATIAATGINALRIPIGYWAYDNADTPYIQGADAYLEQAIGWARKYNMKVWVDCHGSPGSQNGFDNSGHAGEVAWQAEENLNRSTAVLITMAQKYGAAEFADVVVGLEMANEPISWGNNQLAITQSWAAEAYSAVKAVATNPNLVIIMHDAFMGPSTWTTTAQTLDPSGDRTFGIDTHMYQLYTDTDNAMNQEQHIAAACAWSNDLAGPNALMPSYVGEWSAATNICVYPDGSTTNGTSCSVEGCQCQSADFSTWNDAMIEQVRKFVEAQLDTFEASSSGYFLWSAKGPGGWGFLNGIGNGAIPNPVTSRKYPSQCSSY